MIRNYIKLAFLAVISLFCLNACSGEEETLDLVLKANVASFPADGVSQVKFTVYEGNADVTRNASIYRAQDGKRLDGDEFSTETPGEYVFYAEYEGRRSLEVKVTAEPVLESRFVRNICLMEFTDGSCSFCPDASRYIDRNILSKNPDVHLMAFHEKDQWKSDQFALLFERLELKATPAASVDMRTGFSLEQGERDKAKTEISLSARKYPAHCGVSVESSVENGTASVMVTLFSELSADYYLAVYIVEDGVKGYQLDGSIEYEDYYHQFVVRQMLSATVYGDGLGRVTAETEKAKEYTFSCDSAWNLSKTYVYALALDTDGYINNMQVCLLDGGSAGYEYL